MSFFDKTKIFFKYLLKIVKHKCFVFYYGVLYTDANIYDLLIHDFSKFFPYEFFKYMRFFNYPKSDKIKEDFSYAWLHHQNNNKHHYEYWITRTGHSSATKNIDEVKALDMPERYVREMVADWMAASRIYNGALYKLSEWEWFKVNYPVIKNNVTFKTNNKILEILDELIKKGVL